MRAEDVVERLQDLGDAEVAGLGDVGRELAPELAEHLLPRDVAVRDLVELLLEVGREIVLDVALEEALEESGDQPALVLGDELLLLEPDIAAVAQHRKRRGVGGGTADAELLHLLDQRRLGVARRRLGEVLLDGDPVLGQPIADIHRRQAAVVVFLVAAPRFRHVVAAFLVDGEEAVEALDLPGGAQAHLLRRRAGVDVDRRPLELGRGHLAGDGALPDHLVETGLLRLEPDRGRMTRDVGRPDRLVRLLGVLGLRLVAARALRQVAVAVILRDHPADRRERLGRDVDAVGPHVGDVAVLVEPLRDLHGAGGGEAELPRRLLLQRRGGERCRRIAADRLGLDRRHRVGAGAERRLDGAGGGLVGDVEPAELGAVVTHRAGDEAGGRRGLEGDLDAPVFLRLEQLDLALAVADQPQRDRLHPAGGAGAGKLPPQDRRQREADEIVERAAGEIGVDQIAVDLARVPHRVEDRVLGDRVEDDALDRLVLDRALRAEHLEQVPGDRLALAVRVGGKDQPVGAVHRRGDLRQPLARLGVHLPMHREVVLGIDRAVLRRQIADVPVGRDHLIARAQVLVDGLGLGRRFDDDDFHGCLGMAWVSGFGPVRWGHCGGIPSTPP